MTHVTCRLSAKNRDQLRNPTPGNRVWATFTFYLPVGERGIVMNVSVSLCVCDRISGNPSPIFTEFFMHVNHVPGSVFL